LADGKAEEGLMAISFEVVELYLGALLGFYILPRDFGSE